MTCENQITTQNLIDAKADAITIGEIATSKTGAASGGADISTTTNRFGQSTQTMKGRSDSLDAKDTQYTNDLNVSADAFDALALQRVNEIGVIYDSPLRPWSAFLLVDDLRAHTEGGETYIPKAALPFTTGATFDVNNWSLLQGITNGDLINDLSQAYTFPTVAAFKASLIEFPDGKTIQLLDRGADFTKISGTGTANNMDIIGSTSVNQSIDYILKNGEYHIAHFGATAGLGEDISPTLIRALTVAKDDRKGWLVQMPAGILTLSNKVSIDFGNDVTKAIILKGHGTQTQIFSSVVDDTSIELVDAFNVRLTDFTLYGNQVLGSGGNGHGIALRDSSWFVGSWAPAACSIVDVTVRDFRGSDVNDKAEVIRAAGVYVSDGITCVIEKLKAAFNFHGVYSDETQQLKFVDCEVFNNIHSNIFAYKPLDTMIFDNINSIVSPSTETVTIDGKVVESAGIVLFNGEAAISINEPKIKGEGIHILSLDSRSVTVNGGWIQAPETAQTGVIMRGGRAASLIFNDTLLTNRGTAVAEGCKFVSVESTNSSYRKMVAFNGVSVHYFGKCDYFLNLITGSGNDKIKFKFDGCHIENRDSSTVASMQDFIKVDTSKVSGTFVDNYIIVYGGQAAASLTNMLTYDSAIPIEVRASGNEYYEDAGGVITNRLEPSRFSGKVVGTTTTAGNLIVPVTLNEVPTFHMGQATTAYDVGGLTLVPDQSNTTKDQVYFRAYDLTGTTIPGATDVEVMVTAHTGVK